MKVTPEQLKVLQSVAGVLSSIALTVQIFGLDEGPVLKMAEALVQTIKEIEATAGPEGDS